MSIPVRYGLIVGVIGLVLNVVISMLLGLCGPFVAVLVGAAAGFFAARAANLPARSGATRLGATSGAIACAFVLVGQIIAAVGSLMLLQSMGAQPVVGQLPQSSGQEVAFYVGGIGFALCIGVFGMALGAGAGAGAAYLATPERPAEPTGYPPYPPQTPSV